MTKLSYDIARCKPVAMDCAAKEQCSRFTAPHNPNGHQPFVDFTSGADINYDCEAFIPHVSVSFSCPICNNDVSYLSDEIVSIDKQPVCWDCFDAQG